MPERLPVIDVSPLWDRDDADVAHDIGLACRDTGFFYAVGHGVSETILAELAAASRRFFELPEAAKLAIAMKKGGRAWRGYFPLKGELTSGEPDLKEGLYFGENLSPYDERVAAHWPLHGANLYPKEIPELANAVQAFMSEAEAAAQNLLRGIALSLDLDGEYFRATYTARPTMLFRIFHYPPVSANAEGWGVGEHTDYGLLTLLAQDDVGGLEVKTPRGWTEAPPMPGALVCNIGDMLDRLTGGYYRSTPHRVRNVGVR
ncbi:MAG: 2-oxoglutarate and iron-dependent oxygenase domain-containing protein, partial [Pseudomonadota bacterium]